MGSHALFLGLLVYNVRYRDGRYDLVKCQTWVVDDGTLSGIP